MTKKEEKKENRKLIYVCAPFRAKTACEIEKNIERACKYAKSVWAEGYMPIVPHINSRGVFGLYGDNEEVTEFDMQLLAKCDFIRICGKHISNGMQEEINLCKRHKIPIEYV